MLKAREAVNAVLPVNESLCHQSRSAFRLGSARSLLLSLPLWENFFTNNCCFFRTNVESWLSSGEHFVPLSAISLQKYTCWV